MIDLKDKLNIPEGYYIRVGPVYLGGSYKNLIIQDLEVRKIGRWFDHTVFDDYVFLNERGDFKNGEKIELRKVRKFLAQLDNPQPPSTLPAPVVRPGRHS